MNRFEINFSLNDVNMTIDTRTDESDSKEEVALAVKTAIANRLFEYKTFSEMNDDEIDKLIDIKTLSEVEKKRFICDGTKTMKVVVTVDAFDEESASDVARACYKIALELCNNSDKSGIYHFSGMPYVSWYDFAKEIFFQVKQNVDLTPILSVDYTSTAKRPLNSRLECSDIQRQFGINLPYWKKNLKTILRELGEQ